jgi:hypothetical protein
MTIDIEDFYLNTPMDRPEFMRLKLSNIRNNTPVSGHTTGALFVLHSVWTILASSMLDKTMLTI